MPQVARKADRLFKNNPGHSGLLFGRKGWSSTANSSSHGADGTKLSRRRCFELCAYVLNFGRVERQADTSWAPNRESKNYHASLSNICCRYARRKANHFFPCLNARRLSSSIRHVNSQQQWWHLHCWPRSMLHVFQFSNILVAIA